jgi:hypothetical protein
MGYDYATELALEPLHTNKLFISCRSRIKYCKCGPATMGIEAHCLVREQPPISFADTRHNNALLPLAYRIK